MTHQLNTLTSPSYATPSKSREQIAEHIANGYPSPVKYTALAAAVIDGRYRFIDATPVHLRREGLRYST